MENMKCKKCGGEKWRKHGFGFRGGEKIQQWQCCGCGFSILEASVIKGDSVLYLNPRQHEEFNSSLSGKRNPIFEVVQFVFANPYVPKMKALQALGANKAKLILQAIRKGYISEKEPESTQVASEFHPAPKPSRKIM